MTSVIFRRRRLGLTSVRGICQASETGLTIRTNNPLPVTRRREGPWPDRADYVFRWGCTATIPGNRGTVVNRAAAIHAVNDKAGFRRLLMEEGDYEVEPLCPYTWFSVNTCLSDGMPDRVVVRPDVHAQGRRFYVIDNESDLEHRCDILGENNYYISELIDKVAEYRVFVCQGRVVWVARKTPGNPDQVAWNVARGGRFDNVPWGSWPLKACRIAIEGFNLSGLDFGGVDVIVDADNNCYIVEINSAPSQTSEYRQSCVAKAFDYIVRNGRDSIPLIPQRGGWRKFIHPAVSNEAQLV